MSKAIENLGQAMKLAVSRKPKVGGFPYLAESLRRAGATKNIWSLPVCQSLFLTELGSVVMQGTPLVSGMADVLPFDEKSLIPALRRNQAGESTFPEFLESIWRAGVTGYVVDFNTRTVEYQGCGGERYIEAYPTVEIAPSCSTSHSFEKIRAQMTPLVAATRGTSRSKTGGRGWDSSGPYLPS
jgi:uncharacterized protein YbcV (DUF1398 family)